MRCKCWLTHGNGLLWAIALVLAGCGSSEKGDQGPPSTEQSQSGNTGARAPAGKGAVEPSGPAAAVHAFLDAARTGDDTKTVAMLTPLARQEIRKMNLSVAPPRSDTAQFQLGEVKYRGNNGAWVASRWTDLDEDGQPQAYEPTWMVRKEEEGWRVAGMAAVVFEGEPPLVLNFEKPEEVIARKQMLQQEIARRAKQAQKQATRQENPKTPIRR